MVPHTHHTCPSAPPTRPHSPVLFPIRATHHSESSSKSPPSSCRGAMQERCRSDAGAMPSAAVKPSADSPTPPYDRSNKVHFICSFVHFVHFVPAFAASPPGPRIRHISVIYPFSDPFIATQGARLHDCLMPALALSPTIPSNHHDRPPAPPGGTQT